MKLPFDEIYCLHLAEDTIRYNNIKQEFKKIGIEDQVKIWWTCKRPISTFCGNNITSLKTLYYDSIYNNSNKNVYGNVFNCSFEHYTIIKQAYNRGLNSILILEDDIKFTNDINTVKNVFDNMPKDYDIIKFYNSYTPEGWLINNKFNDIYVNPEYNTNLYTNCCSTLCYALSKNGMKQMINMYDKKFVPADVVFDNFRDFKIKFYNLKYNILCIPNDTHSLILTN